jgi:GTPase SAR1 family protein
VRAFDLLRGQVLELFPALLDPAARRLPETAARLGAARARLSDGRLTVVVCGEFKRGKSSLLNALLNEWRPPVLFPEAAEIATNAVTKVSYGPVETVTVLLETPEGTEIVPIGRDEIAGYVTESGNPDNTRRAQLIEIETPNPVLASGLVLVDTPGVGSVYAQHTATTMAFLPSAGAIVFVADATQPLMESELRFLRKAAESFEGQDDAIQFVLTKVDLGDEILANTTAKLAQTLGRDVVVHPVSSHAKRDYLRDHDPEDLELSGFEAFEAALWSALGRRQIAVLLGDALTELDRAAQALAEPLRKEGVALNETTREKVQELSAAAEARQTAIGALQSDSAQWRKQVGDELTDTSRELMSWAQRRLDRVWARFRTEYLYDDAMLAAPDKLVAQLTADLAQIVVEVNERAGERAATILRDLSAKLDLGGDLAVEIGRLPAPAVPEVTVTGALGHGEQPSTLKRKLREMSFGSGIGSTVGGIVGSVLLPGLGSAVGAMIGGAIGSFVGLRSGMKDLKHSDREARRKSVQTELSDLQRDQQRYLTDEVPRLITGFSRAVSGELDSRIRQELESGRDAVKRLVEARTATQQETKARSTELLAELAPLNRVRARVAELSKQVAAL